MGIVMWSCQCSNANASRLSPARQFAAYVVMGLPAAVAVLVRAIVMAGLAVVVEGW